MPIVETRDLVKTYKMGDTIVRALDGLNMQIERGEFMAIMGRSGSGKAPIAPCFGPTVTSRVCRSTSQVPTAYSISIEAL